MKTEFVVVKRNDVNDVVLIQGNRCIKLYAPEPADLRAVIQALEDDQ